jgi:hypothetical protein
MITLDAILNATGYAGREDHPVWMPFFRTWNQVTPDDMVVIRIDYELITA